jgi:DNA-directed RNA polymerase specialized sigma24 family protein
VLPHLDAAYNLARWLTRDDADAQDVVQEAMLRAFRYFNSFHGTRCARLAARYRSQYLLFAAHEDVANGQHA